MRTFEMARYLTNVFMFVPIYDNEARSLSNVPVFKISSEVTFSLQVFHQVRFNRLVITESFMAVPVEGWGRLYYTFTLRSNPSIQIVTAQENVVEITINVQPAAKFELNYKGINFTNNSTVKITLRNDEAYVFHLCDDSRWKYYDLTGTRISSVNPVGVISGNCHGVALPLRCFNASEKRSSTNDPMGQALVTLLPQESFGKQFVIFILPNKKGSDYFVIVPTETRTTITCISTEIETETIVLADPNLKRYATGTADFVIFVAQVPDVVTYLKYDDKSLDTLGDKLQITGPFGRSTWYIGSFPVSFGVHWLHSTYSHKFGLYLYGYTNISAYLNPAGFISTNVNTPCKKTKMTAGDLLDNDCDSNVDEEIRDGKDNDNDSLIDEDLVPPPTTHGEYSPWTNWYCVDCAGNVTYRSRLCNSPAPQNGGFTCANSDTDTKNGSCKDICTMAVDGGWSDWESWECISTNCSNIQARRWRLDLHSYCNEFITRQCNNPPRQNLGRNCWGKDVQIDYLSRCAWHCPTTTTTAAPSSTFPAHNETTTLPADLTAWDRWTTRRDDRGGGSWGHWTEWTCTDKCQETRMIKTRQCDDPPPAPGGAFCPGKAHMYKMAPSCQRTCPDDCPVGRWGVNCSESCENCVSDCDKRHGNCARCKKGFQDPSKSCHKGQCEKLTYGFECQGNCLEECNGYDCIDRATGDCPDTKPFLWQLYLALILLIPVAVLIYFRCSKPKQVDEDQLEEKINVVLTKSGLLAAVSSHSMRSMPHIHMAISRTVNETEIL
ncbi:hypothetical protein Btru_014810 [Bulinus truncatus]|nr:hypothetical protein Btru_014810 [Bulinus truncatus]